ncbi:ankyrin repeat protein, putative [Trichomonas vaginalis G3]|uniref:Ankyrin repeat protein, putative n=1 Tax=Trichomonas vaginalis (strain ATCC PRA-98 / G3) TaxID=412133 RepID=A2GLC6_TRIV3|nr:spectrin binding [Trichomonas vaginalis G3]EAX82040.1 ankyrin repeat protein, putative [Trichomonas vaginalis G3]KAI5530781.1 spectrin binding [Trichomonas vaginalis G3]|eukprot:XP_001294970.1 ankyrin repeat protein [Trichomonas vaginalis G3]
MIYILISNGANPNIKDKNGYYPIHLATKLKDFDIVGFLVSNSIKYTVDVDAKNNDDKTALHVAVLNNSLRIVKLLISHGANINAVDKGNITPFQYAIRNYHREIIKIFISKEGDVNTKVENGLSILHFAAIFGDKEMIEILISNGIDINSRIQATSQSALHISLMLNYINFIEFPTFDSHEIFEFLIENGADINAKDINGKSIFHYAVKYNNIKAIEYLISHNVNVNAANNKGQTALHYAIIKHHQFSRFTWFRCQCPR